MSLGRAAVVLLGVLHGGVVRAQTLSLEQVTLSMPEVPLLPGRPLVSGGIGTTTWQGELAAGAVMWMERDDEGFNGVSPYIWGRRGLPRGSEFGFFFTPSTGLRGNDFTGDSRVGGLILLRGYPVATELDALGTAQAYISVQAALGVFVDLSALADEDPGEDVHKVTVPISPGLAMGLRLGDNSYLRLGTDFNNMLSLNQSVALDVHLLNREKYSYALVAEGQTYIRHGELSLGPSQRERFFGASVTLVLRSKNWLTDPITDRIEAAQSAKQKSP